MGKGEFLIPGSAASDDKEKTRNAQLQVSGLKADIEKLEAILKVYEHDNLNLKTDLEETKTRLSSSFSLIHDQEQYKIQQQLVLNETEKQLDIEKVCSNIKIDNILNSINILCTRID